MGTLDRLALSTHIFTFLLLNLLSRSVISLGPKSVRFSRLETLLPANAMQGEVKVTLDLGSEVHGVTTKWSKEIAQEHYSIPVVGNYRNMVYQTNWYDHQGDHVTAVYSLSPVTPQGQLEVMVSAMTFDFSLEIKRKFKADITLYPMPSITDIYGIEPVEFPEGQVSFAARGSVTLVYKVRSPQEVVHGIHLGRTESGVRTNLNYISIRDNEDNQGIVVSATSTRVGSNYEYKVEVTIAHASEQNEGRLRVKIMNAATHSDEDVTFFTDLIKSPGDSLFQGSSIQMAISSCNPRFINYDTTPVQITMTRGLPNCVYCIASSYPKPSAVEFYNSGHYPVSSGDYHSSYWYSKERDTVEAVLSLQVAIASYAGVYKCEAVEFENGMISSVEFEIVVQ